MARTAVPVTRTSRLAVFPTFSTNLVPGDIVDGMQMFNDGGTMLYVENGGVTSETVSTLLVATVDFQPAGPVVLTIPGLTYTSLLGPFPVDLYGNYLEFDVSSASLGFLAFTLL